MPRRCIESCLRHCLWLAALLAVATGRAAAAGDVKAAAASAPDVLATARKVAAERFKGFTYGPAQAQRQVDCVQFTGAVVEALLRRPLNKAETDALYIRHPFADLQAAVAGGDARTKGIQHALAEIMRQGIVVEPAQVRPGDFVQYWIQRKEGAWAGHSAIVTKVFTDAHGAAAIAIYSSNKSTNGIAEMNFGGKGLAIRGGDRRFYFVRFTGAAK